MKFKQPLFWWPTLGRWLCARCNDGSHPQCEGFYACECGSKDRQIRRTKVQRDRAGLSQEERAAWTRFRFENMLGHVVVDNNDHVVREEHDQLQKIINRAGFFREENDGTRTFLVFPQAFQKEVCAGVNQKFAVRVLRKHGWIVSDGEGKTTQSKRLPGFPETTRVYVFDGAKMWKGEE